MSNTTSKPNQKTSISEKQERDWFIQNANYWISKAISLNDKQFTRDCIDAANGIISDNVFDYVLKPLQMDEDKLKKLPGKIRNIDFLTPIKEKNLGEYIQLPYKFHVITNSPDIVAKRNQEVQMLRFTKLQTLMAEAIQTQQPIDEKALAGIEKEVDDYITNWTDEKAAKGKRTINYINGINNFETERIQRFFYWWATEEFYTYRRLVNKHVIEETISPLEAYPITTGTQFIEDCPGFVVIRRINIHDIKVKYEQYLSEKDMLYLTELETSYKSSEPLHYYNYEQIYSRTDFPESNRSSSRNRDDIIKVAEDGFVKEYLICFITDVKHTIRYYINQIGVETSEVVDTDYVLNPELGDIRLEDKWIQEAWWQIRIGEESDGIYTKPIPYEVQRYSTDGAVKIPFGGKKGLLRDNFLYPIPKRIIGSLALYQIINLQLERTIAKYKGTIEVIPQSLLNGTDITDPQATYFYMLADNRLIYDDTKVGLDVINGYVLRGNDAISTFLKTLIDLREGIRAEAWDMSNMNSNRYGSAAPSETVRNNVSNIQLARLGSVLMIQMFHKALERDHAANLEYGKIAYVEGLSGSYTDASGKIEVVHLGAGDLLEEDFGIFVIDSVIEDQKLEQYKSLAFNMGQNGDPNIASASINSDNSAELQVQIRKFAEAKKEFDIAMKQMEQDSVKMQIEGAAKAVETAHANTMKEIQLKETLQTEREVALKEMDSETKLKLGTEKNVTTTNKALVDNATKIETTKMKPKASSN